MPGQSAQRGTILGIVNETMRKMGYATVSTLSATRTSLLYLDFLNDVVVEVADYGDTWPQLYNEISVSANATAIEYEVNGSAPVKKIEEVHFGDHLAPLFSRPLSQMRLLQRTSATGTPRNFALVRTSGINPILRVHPAPVSGSFNVGCYLQPRVYVSGDAGIVPPFSSRLLVAGVFLKAILDESGGEANKQGQAALATYTNMLREEYNRWTGDTDPFVRVKPV